MGNDLFLYALFSLLAFTCLVRIVRALATGRYGSGEAISPRAEQPRAFWLDIALDTSAMLFLALVMVAVAADDDRRLWSFAWLVALALFVTTLVRALATGSASWGKTRLDRHVRPGSYWISVAFFALLSAFSLAQIAGYFPGPGR